MVNMNLSMMTLNMTVVIARNSSTCLFDIIDNLFHTRTDRFNNLAKCLLLITAHRNIGYSTDNYLVVNHADN